jgi:hypothetical protein
MKNRLSTVLSLVSSIALTFSTTNSWAWSDYLGSQEFKSDMRKSSAILSGYTATLAAAAYFIPPTAPVTGPAAIIDGLLAAGTGAVAELDPPTPPATAPPVVSSVQVGLQGLQTVATANVRAEVSLAAKPGAVLIIRGGPFESTMSKVLFDSTETSFAKETATKDQLVAVVPNIMPGNHLLSVTNSVGISYPVAFTVLESPPVNDPELVLAEVQADIQYDLEKLNAFFADSEVIAKLNETLGVEAANQLFDALRQATNQANSLVESIHNLNLSSSELSDLAAYWRNSLETIPSVVDLAHALGILLPDQPNVNNIVKFRVAKSKRVLDPDISGCPDGSNFVGKYNFYAVFRNVGNRFERVKKQKTASNLEIKVRKMAEGDVLLANFRALDLGQSFLLPRTGGYSDGILSPGEQVVLPLSVCSATGARLEFDVDAFGLADISSQAPPLNERHDLYEYERRDLSADGEER